ncbi:F-box only protein 44 [Patella vulgata]|uniref:F-box only protein 44 n=1 Tax=Patella vulgata TaxID=6465 RepID=UPI00217FCECB|nr:F-box only protein 44 [Patella vulgata]
MSSAPKTCGQTSPVTNKYVELNDDILIQILSHLPLRDLITNIPLVDKRFNGFVQQNMLWEMKCRNGGISTQNVLHPIPDTYKELYFNETYGQNLIKNCCATEKFEHWTIDKDGGDGFHVEVSPRGASPIPPKAFEESGEPIIKNWVTSYQWCKKSQVVNLMESDFAVLMDMYQPDILVSVWLCGRFDCGSEYKLKIQLLDKSKSVIDEHMIHEDIPSGRKWKKLAFPISQYGKGVRYLRWSHSGKDTRFWAGRYGAKFTLCILRLKFSFTTSNT